MPGTPGGPGPQVPGQLTGTRAQQIAAYAQEIDNSYPPGTNSAGQVVDFGQLYTKYMDARPTARPFTVYTELMAELAYVHTFGKTLGGSISTAFGLGDKNIQEYIKGVAIGAEKVTGAVDSPLSGLAAIGDFFSRLSQASTWVRVGEVVLGLGLIIVGLAKIAEGTPVGQAAAKAGKVAALL